MARLLYADDEDSMRNSFLRTLRALNRHEAVIVSDGFKAWTVLQQSGRFDAVITDLEMPNLDGLSLLRRMRSEPLFMSVKCALITGNDRPDLDTIATELNTRLYRKPCSFATIIEELLA